MRKQGKIFGNAFRYGACGGKVKNLLDRPVYHNNYFVIFAVGLREWSFAAFFVVLFRPGPGHVVNELFDFLLKLVEILLGFRNGVVNFFDGMVLNLVDEEVTL